MVVNIGWTQPDSFSTNKGIRNRDNIIIERNGILKSNIQKLIELFNKYFETSL